MKIVFIAPFFFRLHRGIERYTADLSNALARLGVEVHILVWAGKQVSAWGELDRRIRIHELKLPRFFESIFAGCVYPFLLKKINPDVVNFYFIWHGENIAFSLPGKKWKLNCIFHFPEEQTAHRYRLFKENKVMKNTDEYIAVSQFVAEGVCRSLGRVPHVILNGVDTEKFIPNPAKSRLKKDKLGFEENKIVLFTSAAFEKRKGVHKVIAALPKILAECPDLMYVVAGDGPEKNALLQQVRTLGIESRVIFLGVRSDVEALYQMADIFIFLSQGEAFGLAPLEAMSSGLPLIISRRKPFEEIVPEDGAVWVDDENEKEIVDAVKMLVPDSGRRFEMGRKNRSTAEKFNWNLIAERYYQLFQAQIKNEITHEK